SIRISISKEVFKKHPIPTPDQLMEFAKEMWARDEREWQYTAILMCFLYKKQFKPNSIDVYEGMILNKSWRDKVDLISSQCVADYLEKFPKSKMEILNRWGRSENLWLLRVCIIFQLKLKDKTDLFFLEKVIRQNSQSNE